jgi:hypothetical protein
MTFSTNNLDNDAITYEESTQSLLWADIEYRLASPEDQIKLWEPLQQAWDKYMESRINLLKPGMICTTQDVIKMKQIRREICQAATTQTLIQGLAKLVGILLKFC